MVRCRADLRQVYPGDFVLITLGRTKNYKRQIKYIVKLASRCLFLIYDEAQNSSALEANEEVGKLTKATLACFRALRFKLLMSGTSINNNVIESYPQLYLLYNASVNMLCMSPYYIRGAMTGRTTMNTKTTGTVNPIRHTLKGCNIFVTATCRRS